MTWTELTESTPFPRLRTSLLSWTHLQLRPAASPSQLLRGRGQQQSSAGGVIRGCLIRRLGQPTVLECCFCPEVVIQGEVLSRVQRLSGLGKDRGRLPGFGFALCQAQDRERALAWAWSRCPVGLTRPCRGSLLTHGNSKAQAQATPFPLRPETEGPCAVGSAAPGPWESKARIRIYVTNDPGSLETLGWGDCWPPERR
ncbi:Hypothetical predicted protein [Marmota monax]|uniref:Uncharacterized protein n=1 Tax=Marmota monax TaxID=9995 RepID=A0A5E4D298_MARMO|nr:Hypothetical predicted protein [Marmota monax]